MRSVSRWVRAYDAHGNDLVIEWRIPDSVGLKYLQSVFGVKHEDPMYECFPVSSAQAEAIERLIGTRLETAEYDYFLEADAE